jgi:hypothetical protein
VARGRAWLAAGRGVFHVERAVHEARRQPPGRERGRSSGRAQTQALPAVFRSGPASRSVRPQPPRACTRRTCPPACPWPAGKTMAWRTPHSHRGRAGGLEHLPDGATHAAPPARGGQREPAHHPGRTQPPGRRCSEAICSYDRANVTATPRSPRAELVEVRTSRAQALRQVADGPHRTAAQPSSNDADGQRKIPRASTTHGPPSERDHARHSQDPRQRARIGPSPRPGATGALVATGVTAVRSPRASLVSGAPPAAAGLMWVRLHQHQHQHQRRRRTGPVPGRRHRDDRRGRL